MASRTMSFSRLEASPSLAVSYFNLKDSCFIRSRKEYRVALRQGRLQKVTIQDVTSQAVDKYSVEFTLTINWVVQIDQRISSLRFGHSHARCVESVKESSVRGVSNALSQ